MKPRPVSKRVEPAYPTRREFLAGGAAALAALGIAGCGREANASSLVAPLFAHGEGRGATGCVVMSPPVFLSEEEALQVVREELAKAGITLGKGMPLPGVTVEYEDPDARWMRSGENWLGEPPSTVSQPAELAAVDRAQRVGVAIVTEEDCARFRAGGIWCSATSYDTKSLAGKVAEALRGQAKQDLCVGVFYDPLEAWDFSLDVAEPGEAEPGDFETRFSRLERAATEKSREQLRRQVRDFVIWLDKNR